ncbi:ABC transporter ATP-binding protein/permease [Pelosinus propionicus]|uniref:Putative ATP-binding cassette transporter n=1 Tax=Pelosinus propionicus DSM 13327 TaxID=1123291 RepID=A0A1I4NFA8_9FIRM|nr:ABC transporter ATP-binding protein/permease [Pelosinus propionicus]SFM13990.1 putative ATP-binding cassette transporter [Pelosinus propionicus DSM 13327]
MINVYNRNFMQGMWQITKAYWFSEEKWKARMLLAVIVALNLGQVYILVLLNEWSNTFYNTLQNHDKDGFVSAIGTFCILAACHIIVAVYVLYMQQFLELKWRRWLTQEYLQTWLHKQAYYQMQLLDNNTDNPDQRISEDLKLFVNLALGLSVGFLKAAVTLFSFMFILWNLSGSLTIPIGQTEITIPGYMFWVAIIYSIAGNWLTVKIGKPLVNLNFSQQRYEADFRFSLIRLRENSESIALYGGEVQEQMKLTERFQMVFENFKAVMLRQKKLTWFTSGYGQIAIVFPLVVAAPRYFSNQIQLGGLMQINSAFGKVQDSLSFFIESYSSLAQWQSVVKRLLGFNHAMHRVEHIADQKVIDVTYAGETSLHVQQLQIDLPNGEELLKDLHLTIHQGDSLLIMGPSGCGKSTLMRTLAGIWPFGQGSVRIPAEQRLLFLPQRSYLPLGTLRDSVLYPYKEDFATDEEIRGIMELCKLEELADKLDQVEDWSHVLSFGEQQRIAFVRAILQRPDWLFLDEATSAIDEITEAHLYQLLHSQLKNTTIISVGHRNTLVNYHKHKLIIDDTGGWRFE